MAARTLKGASGIAATSLEIGTMCFALLYVFGIFNLFGLTVMPVAFNGMMSGLALTLTLWLLPATKGAGDRIPWYDWVLTLFALLPAVYVFLFYKKRVIGSMLASPLEIVLTALMIVAVLETIRRSVGMGVVYMTIIFPIYALFAGHLPWLLHGPSSSLARTSGYLFLFNDGMFGTTVEAIATTVIAFMLFGQLLFMSGAGKFYMDLALSLFGRFTGGAAKSAIAASGLFGSISGSAMSNVATTGIITIPLMKSVGYRPNFAAAVEAVASTGGAVMPPVMGTVAFIMADYLGIPYANVAVAATLPAILYYLAVFIQVHMEAKKMGIATITKSNLPSFAKTLTAGWYSLIPMVVLIFLLMVMRMDAVEAVGYAMLTALVVAAFKKETRFTPRKLAEALQKTSESLIYVFPICVGAGLLIGSVGLTGLGIRLSQMLISISGNNVVVLVILSAFVCFLIGTGLAMIPTYILMAVLVAPSMIAMGLNAIAVHLFILYWSVLAIITPPVAGAAFAAAAIADSDPMASGWIACRLGVIAFVIPFMFVFNPAVILQGPWSEILIGIVLSVIFTFALAAGLEGFLFSRTNLLQRVMLVGGGVCLIALSWYVRWLGIGLIAAAILWQWRQRKKATA